jgi:hypothetical protein
MAKARRVKTAARAAKTLKFSKLETLALEQS